MLVGGSLVAVDSQALVHGLPLAVAILAEGLHHQLLEVAAEHLQTIAVGEHHQVAAALAFAGGIPGGGHQGGGIVPQARATGEGIHGGGTGQKAAQVGSDQGGGQEANGAGDAGAASHPVGKVEAGQPALRSGESVELAAGHGHGHGLAGPVATEGLEAGPGLLHADAGFRGAAGFAHHHHQGGAQPLAQGGKGAAESLGINVVEDMERQAAPFLLQGADHQQRPQARAADTDPEHIGEGRAGRGADRAGQQIGAKALDPIDLTGNQGARLGIRRQGGVAQPVVTHLTVFVGVGDRSAFEGLHGGEGLAEAGFKGRQIGLAEGHPTDVQPDSQIRVMPEERAETLPESRAVAVVAE